MRGSSWHQTTAALENRAELGPQRFGGKRVELLQPHQCDALRLRVGKMGEQIVVYLAAAQHHAPRRTRRHIGADHRTEAAARREVLEPRHRKAMPQQRFRCEYYQRPARPGARLPTQEMEQVGRRRAIGDGHVAVRAHLQEALDTARGVIGPLPFQAVRQHQRHRRSVEPLVLGAGDELIDNDLRHIGEVAELRLPSHQAFRRVQRVTVFKAEHGIFRQRAADDLAAGLLCLNVVERLDRFPRLLIDQKGNGAERRRRVASPAR